ncbi:MAG TPA: phage recombination protein Bet, partial [Luteimonas sp.]
MNAMVSPIHSGGALATARDMDAVRQAMKTSLYPGATDDSVDMVLAYCRASGLDPMTKPVHIVPMSVTVGKDQRGYPIKEMRDVVMPGIGLYRINAARTGAYAGCSDPEFGPMKTMQVTKDIWTDGPNGKRQKKTIDGGEFSYPEWCRITVTRIVDGVAREFSATEYWIENYATAGNDSDMPNSMWRKRPFGQLAKCTEAQALRKAFPEAVGSQPTADEMEGKHFIDAEAVRIDAPATTSTGAVRMPQAKAPPA